MAINDFYLPRIANVISALACLDPETALVFDDKALEQLSLRYSGSKEPLNFWLYAESQYEVHADYLSEDGAMGFAPSDFYSFNLNDTTFNIYEDF